MSENRSSRMRHVTSWIQVDLRLRQLWSRRVMDTCRDGEAKGSESIINNIHSITNIWWGKEGRGFTPMPWEQFLVTQQSAEMLKGRERGEFEIGNSPQGTKPPVPPACIRASWHPSHRISREHFTPFWEDNGAVGLLPTSASTHKGGLFECVVWRVPWIPFFIRFHRA